MKTKWLQTYQTITDLPKVEFYWHLTASLQMLGFKLPSPDLAKKISRKITPDINESLDRGLEIEGFLAFENHARSIDHESWQHDLLRKLNPNNGIMIPLSELADDEEMVRLWRLWFEGTEEELEALIDARESLL